MSRLVKLRSRVRAPGICCSLFCDAIRRLRRGKYASSAGRLASRLLRNESSSREDIASTVFPSSGKREIPQLSKFSFLVVTANLNRPSIFFCGMQPHNRRKRFTPIPVGETACLYSSPTLVSPKLLLSIDVVVFFAACLSRGQKTLHIDERNSHRNFTALVVAFAFTA